MVRRKVLDGIEGLTVDVDVSGVTGFGHNDVEFEKPKGVSVDIIEKLKVNSRCHGD